MEMILDIMYGVASLFMGIGVMTIPIVIYKQKKNNTELKKLEEQKRILELEIEKQNSQIRLLEVESKKYDQLINHI
jgi:F420-0:gamma-glutamyl ligase